jgi:hypothetical protein
MSSRAIAGLLLAVALVAFGSAVACDSNGNGGADPEEFDKFADKIADAAKDGNVDFFLERLGGETYTCTEDDARYTPAPGQPELDLCLTPGQQFESVFLLPYPGLPLLTSEERLGQDISNFFKLALADAEPDQYGPGGPRLYATARPGEGEDQSRYVSLLTGIVKSEQVANEQGRAVRALYWEYQSGRWGIVGEVGALPPLAVDLIEPSLVPTFLTEWTAYGDAATPPEATQAGARNE